MITSDTDTDTDTQGHTHRETHTHKQTHTHTHFSELVMTQKIFAYHLKLDNKIIFLIFFAVARKLLSSLPGKCEQISWLTDVIVDCI